MYQNSIESSRSPAQRGACFFFIASAVYVLFIIDDAFTRARPTVEKLYSLIHALVYIHIHVFYIVSWCFDAMLNLKVRRRHDNATAPAQNQCEFFMTPVSLLSVLSRALAVAILLKNTKDLHARVKLSIYRYIRIARGIMGLRRNGSRAREPSARVPPPSTSPLLLTLDNILPCFTVDQLLGSSLPDKDDDVSVSAPGKWSPETHEKSSEDHEIQALLSNSDKSSSQRENLSAQAYISLFWRAHTPLPLTLIWQIQPEHEEFNAKNQRQIKGG